MTTQFNHKAPIHYPPLVLVHLIWLDYQIHKDTQRCRWRCLRVGFSKGAG